MARSVAEFLDKNPGYQMVVLAGAGHIMNGYGIPDRFARRTGKKYVTLINGTYSFDPDIADYVLFPQPQAAPASGKLGVLLEKKKKAAKIVGFVPGSPAKEAGLRKGDRIISIDGWKVASVADAKVALFDKLPGQTVTVQVVRKRFLFGSETITVKVTL
jgi:predicted metalloprotease with PDZ domain